MTATPPPLAAAPLAVRVIPAPASAAVIRAWASVFAASDTRSFCLSADWVGTWLDSFGADVGAEVVFFEAGGAPVGAAILGSRMVRRAFVPLRRLYFHTAGERLGDGVGVEYVAPLCHPGHAEAMLTSLAALLRSRSWDELLLPGVSEATLASMTRALPGLAVETEWRPTYQVDLARLRSRGAAYEAVLSRNTRDQLHRSLRLYRARGEVTLRLATSVPEALALFDELGALHRARWVPRGATGGFSSPRWRAFHERLIARAWPSGTVQLARVSAGDQAIGLLHNFVQDGVVAFYQSGLRFEDDNRLKPGLVTHALMIQHCLERGLAVYDFLASEPAGSRYKASLSTTTGRLAWTFLRRSNLRTATVAVLRRVKRALVGPHT